MISNLVTLFNTPLGLALAALVFVGAVWLFKRARLTAADIRELAGGLQAVVKDGGELIDAAASVAVKTRYTAEKAESIIKDTALRVDAARGDLGRIMVGVRFLIRALQNI